jgi:Leucine-rich repeat (LRR) protein
LTEVPEAVSSLTNLIQLKLPNNEISKLPPFVGNLSLLEVLDMSANKFKVFPAACGKLYHLRELHLDYCGVSKVLFILLQYYFAILSLFLKFPSLSLSIIHTFVHIFFMLFSYHSILGGRYEWSDFFTNVDHGRMPHQNRLALVL